MVLAMCLTSSLTYSLPLFHHQKLHPFFCMIIIFHIILLTEIIHLWVKSDVNSISRFFWKKKLMAVLLRFCRTNLGDKIFYCVINWTLWCRNSPLLLHRTVILEISERLKAVRMNNCFFEC